MELNKKKYLNKLIHYCQVFNVQQVNSTRLKEHVFNKSVSSGIFSSILIAAEFNHDINLFTHHIYFKLKVIKLFYSLLLEIYLLF